MTRRSGRRTWGYSNPIRFVNKKRGCGSCPVKIPVVLRPCVKGRPFLGAGQQKTSVSWRRQHPSGMLLRGAPVGRKRPVRQTPTVRLVRECHLGLFQEAV